MTGGLAPAVTGGSDPTDWLPVLAPVVAAGCYLVAATRAAAAPAGWSTSRILAVVGGAVLLAVAFSPAVSAAAHHDPRWHMAQHLVVGMYAPLALVLAAPVTLTLRTLPVRARRVAATGYRSRWLRLLGHPGTALLLDIGGLYLLYLTPLYAVTRHEPLAHAAVQAHLLAAGYLFAWSVVGPDPAPHRPGPGVRLVALFLAAGAHSVLAKLLYARAPHWPPGAGSDPAALREAARLMYYGGDLAELLLAVVFFAAWYRRRPRRARPPQLRSRPRQLRGRPRQWRARFRPAERASGQPCAGCSTERRQPSFFFSKIS